MTGLERNADIVHMATYAPLFAHVDGWQWRPDMIWFDNLRSVRTCSYYVQKLFSTYKGTNVLNLTMDKRPVTGAEGQNGLFASAVVDQNSGEIIVKVANTSDTPQPLKFNLVGMKKNAALTSGRCILFHSPEPDIDNTVDQPERVVPRESPLAVSGQTVETTLAPQTFAVYILK